MSTKIKAYKMYMCAQSGVTCPKRQSCDDKTVWVLPNDHAYDTYDTMVEQVAKAIYVCENGPRSSPRWREYSIDGLIHRGYKGRAIAALRAIGIQP